MIQIRELEPGELTLAGMGSIRYRLAEGTAQLTMLHVSRDHRRRGCV